VTSALDRPALLARTYAGRRGVGGVHPVVLHDAGDAERPGEAQQVGQVAEGAAEQDGTAKRSIHGAPDRRGVVRILRRLRGARVEMGHY